MILAQCVMLFGAVVQTCIIEAEFKPVLLRTGHSPSGPTGPVSGWCSACEGCGRQWAAARDGGAGQAWQGVAASQGNLYDPLQAYCGSHQRLQSTWVTSRWQQLWMKVLPIWQGSQSWASCRSPCAGCNNAAVLNSRFLMCHAAVVW